MRKLHPQTEIYLSLLLTVVFVVGAALTAYWMTNARERLKKLSEPGKIGGKILDGDKPLILKLGGFTLGLSPDALKQGINIGKLISVQDVDLSIKVSDENNRVIVDAALLDENDKEIWSIIRNEIKVNLKSGYDRNYTANFFELISDEKVPLLQVVLKEPNRIFIGGYFRGKSGAIVQMSPNSLTILPNSVVRGSATKPTLLFKYPSYQYQGQLDEAGSNLFAKEDERENDLEQLEKELSQYKDRYSKLSNNELAILVIPVIEKLIKLNELVNLEIESDKEVALFKEQLDKEIILLRQFDQSNVAQADQSRRNEISKRMGELRDKGYDRESKLFTRFLFTYKTEIRANATAIRDELALRCSPPPPGRSPNKFLYQEPRSGYDLRRIANDLFDLNNYLQQPTSTK